MNVDELKQSVAVACHLRESIETTTDKTTTADSVANVKQLQQLQNAIATVQIVALDSNNELKQVIGEEALAQLANTSSHLSLELAAVMSQVLVQEGPLEENAESSTDIVEAVKTNNGDDILKQVESTSENMDQISPQAEVIVQDILSKDIAAEMIELPSTETVEDVINDVTKKLDQGISEALPDQITEDALQVTIVSDGKPFEGQSGEKVVVAEENVLTQTIDATAAVDIESFKPSDKTVALVIAENIATTNTYGEASTRILEQAEAPTEQVILLGEDKSTEKLIASEVATASDLTVEGSLLEPEVITEPVIETTTIQVAPTEQVAKDGLESSPSVTKQQVLIAPENLENVADHEKINIDTEIDVSAIEHGKETTPHELAQSEKLAVDQVTVDSLSTDVVTEEGTVLQLDAVAFAEPTVEQIPDSDIASTTITEPEDIVQPLETTQTAINDVAKEIVDTAILIAEEAIQPLGLEKEEVLDSNIPSTKIILTTDVNESLETISPVFEEQSKEIQPIVTETSHFDEKITEESCLDSVIQTAVSQEQVIISKPETNASAETLKPDEQEKSEDTPSQKSDEEFIKIETVVTSEETIKVELVEAKTIEQPFSEEIDSVATKEETKLTKEQIAISDGVVTEQPVAFGKKTITCVAAEETKPLYQEIDKSNEQELKVIETGSQLVTESVEIIPATDKVESQPSEQDTAFSDAEIIDQSEAFEKETTTSIQLEKTVPFSEQVAVGEHGNVDKSIEQEQKISEIKMDTESVETSKATDVLEQEISISDTVKTEQQVAVGKETTTSLVVEESIPLTQEEIASGLEPKVTETVSELDTENVKITESADIAEPQYVDLKAISNAETIVTETVEPATAIETEVIEPLEQEKVALDAEKIEISTIENIQTIAVSAAEELKQPELEKLLSEDTQKPQTENVDISSEKIEETKVSEPITEPKQPEVSEETKRSEQENLVSEVKQPQEENFDITSEKSEEIKVSEPATESKQVEVPTDTQTPDQQSVISEVAQKTEQNIAVTPEKIKETEVSEPVIESKQVEVSVDTQTSEQERKNSEIAQTQQENINKTLEKIEDTKVSEIVIELEQVEVSTDAQISEQDKIFSEVAQPQEEHVDIVLEKTEEIKVSEPRTEETEFSEQQAQETLVTEVTQMTEDMKVLESASYTKPTEAIEDIEKSETSSTVELQATAEIDTKQTPEDSVTQPTAATKITLGNNKCCDASINDLFLIS